MDIYAASIITFSSVSGLLTSTDMLRCCSVWALQISSWTVCVALRPWGRTEGACKGSALWSQLPSSPCGHANFRAAVVPERSGPGKEGRRHRSALRLGCVAARLNRLLPDQLVSASRRPLSGNWPFPKASQPERGRTRTSYRQQVASEISDVLFDRASRSPGPQVTEPQLPH